MKILFFGRGAIGTQYAWAFEKAGHTVEFYVREGRTEEYGSYVNLEISDGRKSANRKINEQWSVVLREEIKPDENYDLIFFSVNPGQVKQAVEYLAPRVGNATVLFFNNYGRDPKKAVEPIPQEQVVFGFPGAGGGYEGNTLYGIMYKTVQIGMTGSTLNEREKEVLDLFKSAGFRIGLQKNIHSWLLNHYVMNAAMETEVLKRGSFKNVVTSKDALANMVLNIRELIPYLEAKKVPSGPLMKVLSILPAGVIGFLLKNMMYAPGSMAYEAIVHNHFKVGYAVEEILEDAKTVGITLPRLGEAVKCKNV